MLGNIKNAKFARHLRGKREGQKNERQWEKRWRCCSTFGRCHALPRPLHESGAPPDLCVALHRVHRRPARRRLSLASSSLRQPGWFTSLSACAGDATFAAPVPPHAVVAVLPPPLATSDGSRQFARQRILAREVRDCARYGAGGRADRCAGVCGRRGAKNGIRFGRPLTAFLSLATLSELLQASRAPQQTPELTVRPLAHALRLSAPPLVPLISFPLPSLHQRQPPRKMRSFLPLLALPALAFAQSSTASSNATSTAASPSSTSSGSVTAQTAVVLHAAGTNVEGTNNSTVTAVWSTDGGKGALTCVFFPPPASFPPD